MQPFRSRIAVCLTTLVIPLAGAGDIAAPQPAASSPASSAAASPLVTGVGAIGVTVSDLDAAVAWYGILGFQKIDEFEVAGEAHEHLTGVFGLRCRIARLRLGDEVIELTDYLAPEGRPIPADSRSNDRWFQHIAIVVRDIDEAYAHLRAHGVRHASAGPQTLPRSNPNAGGISAFYFKDPDGHVLEIIHFPPDKGDPRWRRPDPPLFMGIDHTAIVVADTDASLAFYRDALGMRIAGTAENFGVEQERLNNVFGVRLRITALDAGPGPGVELLEYLAPATGRDYPADSTDNDLWSWRTTLITSDAAKGATAARTSGEWISPGVIHRPADALGLEHAAMVRDPDGHAILFAQPR